MEQQTQANKTFMAQTLAHLQHQETSKAHYQLRQMRPLRWHSSTTNWAQIGILMLYASLSSRDLNLQVTAS
jgi:hypothetical protein